MRRWVTGIVAISIGLGGVALYFGAGAYDMGADAPHWDVTRRVIETIRDRSIAAHSRNIDLPELQDQQRVSKGAGQYAAMCVNCHLAPGIKDSDIRPGLYPQPPNLSEQRIDPKRAFWVVKHGLKMSGMPAWGVDHDDDTIWSIVAFVTRLPGPSADHYKEMVANAPPDEEMGDMKMDGDKDSRTDGKGAAGISGSKPGHPH